ncbi:MAG: DUF4397 domain-containing protein [Armatimonadetes bacterium]|nr:DUF4397 domain-containing protein [Armatimonadota bacterium]
MLHPPWRRIAACACALAVLTAGCGGGGGGLVGENPTVFLVNASPDSAALDFLLNEDVRGLDFQYLETALDFEQIPFISDADGAYDLITRDNVTGEEYDAENRVFDRSTDSAIIAVGIQGFVAGEEIKRLRSIVVDIDRTVPNGNKARLYVVHAFVRETGFSTPQIVFQNAGDNPQFATGGIDFASTASLTVDSGEMDWVAKREDADSPVIYAQKTETLDPGGLYLVLVSGVENDPDAAKQPKLTFVKLTTE